MLPIRFSIIITCHNQREFIRTAVDSALSQPRLLKEVIVIDDGSTDGSVELLEQFADSIRLIKFSSNRGAIEAYFSGGRLPIAGTFSTYSGDSGDACSAMLGNASRHKKFQVAERSFVSSTRSGRFADGVRINRVHRAATT